jgi:hypothetical protein
LKKSIQTTVFVAAVTAEVDADYEMCINSLALAHDIFVGTIFVILYKDLGLIKKNSRWGPKLSSKEQTEKKVETSATFFNPNPQCV